MPHAGHRCTRPCRWACPTGRSRSDRGPRPGSQRRRGRGSFVGTSTPMWARRAVATVSRHRGGLHRRRPYATHRPPRTSACTANQAGRRTARWECASIRYLRPWYWWQERSWRSPWSLRRGRARNIRRLRISDVMRIIVTVPTPAVIRSLPIASVQLPVQGRGAISVPSGRWWCQPVWVRATVVLSVCFRRLWVAHIGAPLNVFVSPPS